MNKIDNTFASEDKYYICLDINGVEYWTKQLHPLLNRGAIISEIIRLKYSADDVEAILANGTDTEAHTQEYNDYQQFRADVKTALAELQSEIDAINEEWESRQKPVEPIVDEE